MKIKFTALLIMLCAVVTVNAQIWKKKDKEKNDTTAQAAPGGDEKKEKKGGIGGFFQKTVAKVSKAVGNTVAGMTGDVAIADNLENVDVIPSVGTNIYPKDLGLVVTDFLGKDWIDHGDFTMLMLASKDGYQFFKYAGTIKINNKELRHASYGIHTVVENPGSGNKKISFEKNGIVEGSFIIPAPEKNIKLVSVNGQTSSANVDFTKGVTLELQNFSTASDDLIRVDVVYSVIGIRTLGMVAYVKPAAKIIIPASAFRNIETENKGVSFKNSYLAISQQKMITTTNNTGVFTKPLNAITGSNDGMWMNISNSEDIARGIQIEDELSTDGNKQSIIAKKKNAAYAMPLSMAKKIAAVSVSIQGTTYLHDQKTNRWTQTETTKEIQFPQIPEAWLDATLADMYKQFTTITEEVTGGKMLPEGTVPSLPSYNDAQKFFKDEVSTADQFLRVYKDLSPVKPLTSASTKINGENAMLKEAGADGLLKINLSLQLSYDGKPAMTPYLTIEMDGASNGSFRSFVGNTKYFSVMVKGSPYIIKKGTTLTQDELVKITQVPAFAASFKKVLVSLKEKEKTMGDYEEVWNLQR